MAKPIEWNPGAKRDFEKTFDEDGQDVFRSVLDDVAEGHSIEPDSGVKDDRHGHPMPGHVRKLKWDDDNNSTWRVVYVQEYDEAIYVINAYQKKSKRGSQEPKENLQATETRLKWAEARHAAYLKKKAEEEKSKKGQGPKKGGKR